MSLAKKEVCHSPVNAAALDLLERLRQHTDERRRVVVGARATWLELRDQIVVLHEALEELQTQIGAVDAARGRRG
jgi:hypothetical protein